MSNYIKINNAYEHNLKNISVSIPKNKITAVTGVSGSGKSSLIYDILYKEGYRNFFSSYSSFARQYLKSMGKAKVKSIKGLTPVIGLSQQNFDFNSRSTVGTLTGIYDLLRLLFARFGENKGNNKLKLSRSLFSFNTNIGACKKCNGLALEEKIDIEKLIADKHKSLREGALVLSTGNKGYIMYSQVTIDVLDKVLNMHGFSVDKPFKDLTDEELNVVFYGSDRIKIPFGKHSLESRLKWTGITAKPREEGFYKGIIPVMEEILKRDRNKNILKYVKSVTCSECGGSRLNSNALNVYFMDKNIFQLSQISILELHNFFEKLLETEKNNGISKITEEIIKKTKNIIDLGLSYLTLTRVSSSLSGGEIKRIKLSNLANSKISGVTYIFDEPSVGLHSRDNSKLIEIFEKIKLRGNTVIVVEHNTEIIKNADYIVEIGKDAGINGGNLIYQGYLKDFLKSNFKTYTKNAILKDISFRKEKRNNDFIEVKGLKNNNLKNINVKFMKNAINTITGVSGSGKSSLMEEIYQLCLEDKIPEIDKVIYISQSEIGKTSRSNPATYTKVFDKIRALFSSLNEAKVMKYNKSTFSFNVKGGRCEHCEGSGVKQIGMHFLGNVELKCEFCEGKRFKDEVLTIKYNGLNISDILNLSINKACKFFKDEKDIFKILKIMKNLGLGYLTLGQNSNTLSGGEAGRLKLAASLAKPSKNHTLYLFDEPTTGLHPKDVEVLLNSFNNLIKLNNTVLIVEHDSDIISNSDFVVDLGPESGEFGGEVIFEGIPDNLVNCEKSITGKYLSPIETQFEKKETENKLISKSLKLTGVSTNNLKNIDIEIKHNSFTAITGISGSGKSSLLFDTIYPLSQSEFLDNLKTYQKSLIKQTGTPEFETVEGLIPAISIKPETSTSNGRSTVGTVSEIYTLYRLLFSRFGTIICPQCDLKIENSICKKCGYKLKEQLTSSNFSFNSKHGACENCKGLGTLLKADPKKIVTNENLSFFQGAINGTKTGKFYGDINGQYAAILKAVGDKHNINFNKPVKNLTKNEFNIAMYGIKDEVFDITWNFKRKNRTGEHSFQSTWIGFANLIDDEYLRKQNNKRGNEILPLLSEYICEKCNGTRLNEVSSKVLFENNTIFQLGEMEIFDALNYFNKISENSNKSQYFEIFSEIINKLSILNDLGLGHLTINRKSNSLSSGEFARLKLASSLFSNLSNMMILLDEPTAGLSNNEIEQLVKIIEKLKNQGNTIVAVDHRKKLIEKADEIIELGPKPSKEGGKIIFKGNLNSLKSHKSTETYKLMFDSFKFEKPKSLKNNNYIEINNAFANNLKIKNIKFPVNDITVLTGVSGSGKTSLLFDTLFESYEMGKPVNCSEISGLNNFENIYKIAFEKIGNNSLSTVATYLNILDELKNIFSKLKEVKEKKIKKSAFSYNSKEGCCKTCKGMGKITTSLDFISDSNSICEDCNGLRYNKEILNFKLNGKNIAEILDLDVIEALTFFKNNKKLTAILEILEKTGLGHLKLNQTASTLSSGEGMRLKLSKNLIKTKNKNSLFLFDEPTRGLSFTDSIKILQLMYQLVNIGNTVILIEHNPLTIENIENKIILGPGAGKYGGLVV